MKVIKFEIFEEGNNGPLALQNKMNDFFSKKNVQICNVNVVVEKVGGIDCRFEHINMNCSKFAFNLQ